MNMTEEEAKQKYCPFRQDACCASACMMWNTKKIERLPGVGNVVVKASFCSLANIYNTTMGVI